MPACRFVIKYVADAAAGGGAAPGAAEEARQSSLRTHWDESCFSFIVQLNNLDEFEGGGTKFAHASEALSVAPGEAMCFCGYNLHEGVRIARGARYLLTGFVDLRAPPSTLARFTEGQPVARRTPAAACLTDFASPHLPFNVAMLRARYETRGEALLHAIAYAPASVPFVDMRPLAQKCDRWLTKGECDDENFYRFLCQVIGEDGSY